jgi:hypothetical protein
VLLPALLDPLNDLTRVLVVVGAGAVTAVAPSAEIPKLTEDETLREFEGESEEVEEELIEEEEEDDDDEGGQVLSHSQHSTRDILANAAAIRARTSLASSCSSPPSSTPDSTPALIVSFAFSSNDKPNSAPSHCLSITPLPEPPPTLIVLKFNESLCACVKLSRLALADVKVLSSNPYSEERMSYAFLCRVETSSSNVTSTAMAFDMLTSTSGQSLDVSLVRVDKSTCNTPMFFIAANASFLCP